MYDLILSSILRFILFLSGHPIQAHPLLHSRSSTIDSFPLRATGPAFGLDGWAVQHVRSSGSTGILQIQQATSSDVGNAHVGDGKLVLDDDDKVVLPAILAQITTQRGDGGSSGFSVNVDGYIALGRSGVEGFWACPSIVPAATAAEGQDCAQIPTPCSEQTYTLWYDSKGSSPNAGDLPIGGCEKVKLWAAGPAE